MAIAAVFIGFAVTGFKRNPWLVVVALAAHGVMDVWAAMGRDLTAGTANSKPDSRLWCGQRLPVEPCSG